MSYRLKSSRVRLEPATLSGGGGSELIVGMGCSGGTRPVGLNEGIGRGPRLARSLIGGRVKALSGAIDLAVGAGNGGRINSFDGALES
jgi:hypothetical protein